MNENNASVIEIMPGCKILKDGQGFSCMFGVPAEVLKVYHRKNLTPPSVIIAPDEFFKFGIVQCAMEFILYEFLFVQGRFFKGEKLTFIGTKTQNERVKKILRLTLLGPSQEQMEQWNISPERQEQVLKLSNHFALKKLGTKEVAEIEDMIDFVEFVYGKVVLPEGTITKKGLNVFHFNSSASSLDCMININLTEPQVPVIPIEIPSKLSMSSVLGATALSKCTTGFDPTGYTSGIILWLNFMGVSVDGVSWMKEHLKAMGINPQDIQGHIITHVHDDHSNIFDLIVNGKVFKLISDILNYHMVILKSSLILDLSEKDVEKMIQLIEFNFYEPFYWYGAKFVFWPTAHPIPTFGFSVEIEDTKIVYSGDTLWGSKLDKLLSDNVVDARMYSHIKLAPNIMSGLVFHDAGGGMIHPDLSELGEIGERVTRSIVPTHLQSLPPLCSKFDLIKPGQNWEIIPSRELKINQMLRIHQAPIFASLSKEWMNVVMAQGKVKQYNANCEILRQGESGSNFFVIIGGTVEVFSDDKKVAELATGDFFGEMSLMYNQFASATVRAKSQVYLLELNKDVFTQIINSTGLAERLEKLHQIRPILMQFALLRYVSASIMQRVCEVAKQETFKAGEVIIRQGEIADKFYGILHGQAKVFVNKLGSGTVEVATLYENQVFGEIALLKNCTRNATVVAEIDVQVFYLDKQDFYLLIEDTPMLFHQLGILANMRAN